MTLAARILLLVSALYVTSHAQIARAVYSQQDVSPSEIAITLDETTKKSVTFGAGFVLETGINGGTEGGLYPELLANRDFAQNGDLKWLPVGQGASVVAAKDIASARRIGSVTGPASVGVCGISNDGFHDNLVYASTPHRLFFSIRSKVAQPVTKLFKAGLYSKNGQRPLLEGSFEVELTNEWRRHAFILNSKTLSGKLGEPAKFIFQSMDGCGSTGFQLSTMSLFGSTWRNLPIRTDLGQALAELNPAYVRIAAGNDLVGADFGSFFNWTQSIGFIDERIGRGSSWGGRHLSNGFGLMEQLDLAEQLGALPILGIYAGWSFGQVASRSEIPQFVALALDLLHFCLDDSTTALGQLRAQYGRDQPYIIRQVEVGNEDFATPQAKSTYKYRYEAIADAIRQAFPQLEIIATTEVSGATAIDVHRYGTDFSDMYPRCNLIPESSQAKHAWMMEYAARGNDFPTLGGSLAEAVGLLGMEINGDVNRGAAYAPLLQYLDDGKKPDWTPSLISFDNLHVSLSTSYYVLEGFGKHRVRTSFQTKASIDPHVSKVFHSIGLAQNGQDWFVKLVNTNDISKIVSVNMSNSSSEARVAQVWQMQGPDARASNRLGGDSIASAVSPAGDGTVTFAGNVLRAVIPPNSFTIITLSAEHSAKFSDVEHEKSSHST